MKLSEYLIREAVDKQDWSGALNLLIEKFELPVDVESVDVEEHIATQYGKEVNLMLDYYIYTWHEDAGFCFRKTKRRHWLRAVIWSRPSD